METTIPNAEEVRDIARKYLRRAGMAPADFARRCGYAYSPMQQFLKGTYKRGPGSKEAAICTAILEYIGTSHIADPDAFSGKLYEIGNTKVMRDLFRRLSERPCIMLAYAPPGSGKTDVAKALMPQYQDTATPIHRVYCRAGITPRYLMQRISIACGSIGGIHVDRMIQNLRYDFRDRRAVLYLDEAQHMSVECFETIRELYDELRWSICLAGSHQLDRIFTKWAGDLEQLERRVTGKITLPAVTPEEAENIVRSELPQLKPTQTRALVERSHVDIRVGGQMQRYLSIGRVMANIREVQELFPEAVDAERPEVTSINEVSAA